MADEKTRKYLITNVVSLTVPLAQHRSQVLQPGQHLPIEDVQKQYVDHVKAGNDDRAQIVERKPSEVDALEGGPGPTGELSDPDNPQVSGVPVSPGSQAVPPEEGTGTGQEKEKTADEAAEEIEAGSGEYDPGEHSVEEVLAYLKDADEGEVARVKDVEASGKDRSTITNYGA
jgi:hypothetical protein